MFNYTVKVYPIQNPKSKIVAYASLLIEDCFEVTGFKIFSGSNGLFVKPPQHKGKNKEGGDEWYDDARFVGAQSKELREEVFATVVDSYNNTVRNSSRSTSANLQTSINNNTNSNNYQSSQSQQTQTTRKPLW